MKAVILAAGEGTRLKPLTNNIPKAFLSIGDIPLIYHSLRNLHQVGVDDVLFVTGFMESHFKKTLGDVFDKMNISYVSNPDYAKTNSMYSLSQIEGVIDEDIILLESDLIYEQKALELLLESQCDNVLLTSKLSGSGDEVFICTDETGRITDLGKNISQENKGYAIGELVGISKFSKKFLSKMFTTAKNDYKKGEKTYHYEECAFRTSSKEHPLYALLCEDLTWIEIDTKKDLQRAEEIIYPQIIKKEIA